VNQEQKNKGEWFLAAADSGVVSMKCLIKAVRCQFQKTGISFNAAIFIE